MAKSPELGGQSPMGSPEGLNQGKDGGGAGRARALVLGPSAQFDESAVGDGSTSMKQREVKSLNEAVNDTRPQVNGTAGEKKE